MSEWNKVKLEEILQVKKGEYITKKEAKEGIYPVILGGKEPAYYINKFNHTGKAIVISRSGASAGYVSFWNEPIFVTDGFLIEPKDNVNFEFLYYILKSKQRELHNTQKGAAIPHVTPALIGSIDGLLPDILIQQNIVSILSRYDTLIENYQKQIKLLEEAAQRLYKEWFVDLRFPGHENTKIVDGVPEDWEKKTINDICTHISSGSTPSRRNKSYWENGTIKWIKTKELLDGWIFDTEEYITDDGLKNSSTKIYPVNSILMAIYASPTLGRLGILASECCCNQAALCLIANEQIVSWQWLYWKLFELRDEFNSIARGAGQQNISGIVVKNKEVLVPTRQVIDAFTNIANPIFQKIKKTSYQIHLLTEARDRLLPKLMSGEITV